MAFGSQGSQRSMVGLQQEEKGTRQANKKPNRSKGGKCVQQLKDRPGKIIKKKRDTKERTTTTSKGRQQIQGGERTSTSKGPTVEIKRQREKAHGKTGTRVATPFANQTKGPRKKKKRQDVKAKKTKKGGPKRKQVR